MMQDYNLKITFKTKCLNSFRRLFMFKISELFLINFIRKIAPSSLYNKFVPPNYLYSPNSKRIVQRDMLNYDLDLSDVVDHGIYFQLKDSGRNKLYALTKKEMTVFDIGANMGDTALNFSKIIGPKGNVIAFEPDDRNYKRALRNFSLNLASNITLLNIGLGEENKTEKLYRVNLGNQGMNRILKDEHNYDFTEITIRKLDSFITEHSTTKVDLVKIDVEGFEMNVLKGSVEMLKKFNPILFIEINDNNLKEHSSSASELFKFLNELNYTTYHSGTNKELTQSDDFKNCHFDIYALQKNKRIPA